MNEIYSEEASLQPMRTANDDINRVKETVYKEIAALHVGHTLNNRPYDNVLFRKMIQNMWAIEDKYILEFWCWHGHYANLLLENWWRRVFWVDIDDKAIETANKNNKGWKFINLSDNGIGKITDMWVLFDEIYAMYVFETIKEKKIIQSICSDIYAVLVSGWKLQFMIGNIEEFYGKKCIEFEFPIDPRYLILKDGDPYIARLVTENWFFDVQDFYYSQETIVALLENAWFKDISIQKYRLYGDEYDGMIDEKEFAPSVIFTAKKW